ncbi:MAG: hypothetical protein EZS28_002196 [Streblomastix strix]|uniref:Cyclin N-terminal domain-containing protein n=1 Tax=Streblomastix strix TaxID=222440 RepID=A0A5J4X4W4_9EUKA|nr:MAG: hypothetical protein EZS28_002196 [Streblomastix strix]
MSISPNLDLYSDEQSVCVEYFSEPEFDKCLVQDEIIKFAAFCVAKVVTRGNDAFQNTFDLIELFFSRIRTYTGLCSTELLQALAFVDIISKSNKELLPFVLTKLNVYLVLLVCLMIAHKSNSDVPLSNFKWANLFGVNLSLLNESEIVVLKLLNFNTNIPEHVFQMYKESIQLMCPIASESKRMQIQNDSNITINLIDC